jgi:hypothetical protein
LPTAYDDIVRNNRADYVTELLKLAAEKEIGFSRAAADVIRQERPGVMSSPSMLMGVREQ